MFIAIALALLDFAPVFFLSLGLFFLAQLVDRLDRRCGVMARVGFGLVTIGGLARAGSNLSLAIYGQEIPLLATTFYVFGAPGFTLVAAAMFRARAAALGQLTPRDPWIAPSIVSWSFLIAAFYLQSSVAGPAWSQVLVLLALIGGALTCLVGARLGWTRQLHMAAGLFAFNFAGTVFVIVVRAVGPQHVLVELGAELLNVAAQAAFAFAAWRVAAEYHARVGPTAGG